MYSLDDVASAGRTAAEDLMADACTITRETGATTGDGLVRTPTFDEVYAGKCRVRPAGTQDRMVDVAGDDVGVVAYVVSIPIGATGILPGDLVTITATASDGDQADRVLVVLGAIHGSQITARRLGCQEAR